ncbi:MAG: hypothetical protein R6W93_04240 [Candidatus Limnocylindrales bacterium]|jgi:hypothetical protein
MQHQRSSGSSPVDNHTYNVLQALTSTLEAVAAYERYREDGGGDLFDRLLQEEGQHAELLLAELRTLLGSAGEETSRS